MPAWSKPLERVLGAGGFAVVWQVAGEASVLKLARASHDLARAQIAREAEALGAIGAPAVPRLHAQGVLPDGRAWIEMERVTGTNLGDIIAAGLLKTDHVIALGILIAEGVARIHEAGFAHRDLKPDNIVRRADGSLVILDLGLARRLPDDPDDPNRGQVGSIEYMAPEQIHDSGAARAPADIYALGCILYELCSGRLPFVGDANVLSRAHQALRPPPLSALVPTVPPALEQLALACLAKQPDRRPPSALDVAARLRAVRDDGSQRTQHSMSRIGGGKQPVVLLWAELPKVDRALIGTLSARKVTIVSQRGRRILGGVAGIEHNDPASAAIAAARDLAAAGARVALHLDAVIVNRGPTSLTFIGSSVERPEEWLPTGAWTGVLLTRTLATVTQLPTRPAEQAGFVTLAEATAPSDELFGRDALISDIVAEAATVLSGLGPGLTLVIGDPGIGKTVVARALAPRLVDLGARVISGVIPPPGSGRPGYSALAELVGESPQGPIVRAVGDAIRAAARKQPLAIILDELHLAEHELFDALEYATLGGEPLPLWIVGFAAPRLEHRRPGFGQRAERPLRLVLPPLDEEASIAMTAALLRPAEYPPVQALKQLARIARGNPMHLSTLVRELHDRGAIRTRENGNHILDTTVLDTLPPIALGPWLAARELAAISDELVSLARVCAILGDDISRDEIAGVIQIAEQRGVDTTTVDLDVGLAELVGGSILIAGRDSWSFRQTLLEEGIYTTTEETARHGLHAAALAYWQTKPADDTAVAERVSRHAEAIGERRIAAAAFAVLGEHAHREHRTLDADQAWQGAVRNLDAPDLDRGRALLGRARARYRLQRVRDALVDLDEVLAIAHALGERTLEVEALIQKATAHDWSDEFDASATATTAARDRLGAGTDPLALDVELAEGRSLFRLQKFALAAPHLRRVMGAAHDRDAEVETIAGVLLGPALVELGDLDEAETVFADVIRLCERTGDRLHFGAAHANRTWLWSKRGEVEQNANDLRIVIQVARENGQASLERIGTYNLAEDRLWQGALDEALQLARRSLAIQRGHGEGDDNLDLVLLARVLAAKGDREELATILALLATEELPDADRRALAVLACVRDRAPHEAWQRALADTEDLSSELRLELAHLAIRDGHLEPQLRDHMREVARLHPIWARRSEL